MAAWGEGVFHIGRNLAVVDAGEEAVVYKLAELFGKR